MLPAERFLDLVIFRAAGHRVGLEAVQVLALVATAGENHARPIEDILNLPCPPADNPVRTFLVLRDGAARRLVAVAPPVELCRVAVSSVHPVPPLIAARTRLAALRALALDATGVILLLGGLAASVEPRLVRTH